jgi:hypothetical protein
MNLKELNQHLKRLLNTCPKRPSTGVNLWILKTAWQLFQHVDKPEVMFRLLKAGVADCGRLVSDQEIQKAVNKVIHSDTREARGRSYVPSLKSDYDRTLMASICGKSTLGVFKPLLELRKISPIRVRKLVSVDVLSALYPESARICWAYDKYRGSV